MKTKILFFYALVFLLQSCSYEMNENQILNAILKGESNKVHVAFYKDYEIDKNKLAQIIEKYSTKINDLNLKPILYRDKYTYKRGSRFGYMFVDDDNNIYYSITFKFKKMKNGDHLVKYMDFRAAEGDLPNMEFPNNNNLEGVIIPTVKPTTPAYLDSLKVEGPKIINGIKFYSEYILKPDYLKSYGDSLKTNVLRFNFGNKKIKNNIGKILGKLSTQIDLKKYAFSYYESYSQKTIIINYFKSSSFKDVNNLRKTLEEVLNTEVKLERLGGRSQQKLKYIMVGTLNSDPRIYPPFF